MNDGERGSALVMAIFVLVLLTGMGAALLFVSENEVKMGAADLRYKEAFYFAEAGLEDARETLRIASLTDPTPADRLTLDDDLAAAAGANGTIDFDAGNLRAVTDASGNVTGFTGPGDDVLLKTITAFGRGRYAAFLTNDPIDGRTSLTDTNNRAMVTALGAGPGSSLEVVQAIVKRQGLPALPATITIVGPTADFDGGNSNAKEYSGDDCGGSGIPGLSVPVVGVIGAASKTAAETGVHKPGNYNSGPDSGTDTVVDVDATIDPALKNCGDLLALARTVRAVADVIGTSATPLISLGTPADPRIVFIEGDYTVGPSFTGAGLLWVTGTLTFSGNADWTGVIFTVGRGEFQRSGAGNGVISGSNLVANISGPDGTLWSADDCAGVDGVVGTVDDGAAIGTYNNSGAGTGDTVYCSNDINAVQTEFPFAIVSFRER